MSADSHVLPTEPRVGSRRSWLSTAIAAIALWAVAALLGSAEAQARLQPYYIIVGAGFGAPKPRIALVLDTSGSMARKVADASVVCDFETCETPDPNEYSRIYAARNALRSAVEAASDGADFSLMTFSATAPPTTIPPKCASGLRFAWETQYSVTNLAGPETRPFTNPAGGHMVLCDGSNFPYPYLRWDDLGETPAVGANRQTGALPPSPVIDPGNFASNLARKVQWFPDFLGQRTHLDCDNADPAIASLQRAMSERTVGDYGDTTAVRDVEVCNHDYYYYPYVDGFVGYSMMLGTNEAFGFHANLPGSHIATLYVPFYLDLGGSPIPVADRGPASRSEANDRITSLLQPQVNGGLDVKNRTYWDVVIGDIPPAGSVPQVNSAYGHDSVASYLKFVSDQASNAICTPLVAVLITDGIPDVIGDPLYSKIAALRNVLGVKTYVMGFMFGGVELHDMACAAAGACDVASPCDDPCQNTPANNWDTCRDDTDPANACAFSVENESEFTAAITEIVFANASTSVSAGPGLRLNDVRGSTDPTVDETITQTSLEARTEWPAWRGHIERKLCTDKDPDDPTQPAPWCIDQGFTAEELAEPTFGPCARSREWDAGECLRLTAWDQRRIYSTKPDGTAYLIWSASAGQAASEFKDELVALGVIASGGGAQAEADALAAFVLGRDFTDGWKLPGLSLSTPSLIRRIPRHDPTVYPEIAIRDPHCSGRAPSQATSQLPTSLVDFAKAAWDPAAREPSPSPHYEYQEAVLVGDDLGILHAFHYDSGNEMWGYLPRFVLQSAYDQLQEGPAQRGQPSQVKDHHYGISASPNQGWVYDAGASRWRHLAVFGLGVAGREWVALDLSHTSPFGASAPGFEVLWTSEDTALKATYDLINGETWSRPALTYRVPGDDATQAPEAFLVMASGYATGAGGTDEGRTVALVDAVTGQVLESADVHTPTRRYDMADFGLTADLVVATHCRSGFWAEMQEVYIVDAGGRVMRWDQGGYGTAQAHAADLGGTWNGERKAANTFWSCRGTGSTCTVDDSSAARVGDVFAFAPAVSSVDRIDPLIGAEVPTRQDQFLIALNSGAPADDSTDSVVAGNDFHSSLYLIRDDHRSDPAGGIPSTQTPDDPANIGTRPDFMRLVVSELTRTRQFTPFAGSTTYSETANFDRGTRPMGSPRIEIRSVRDSAGDFVDELEVYFITYTLYEPPKEQCDAKWLDPAKQEWHHDEGSVHKVTLRLVVNDDDGFDFTNGPSDDFGFPTGLTLVSVEQVLDDDCADGVCSPKRAAPRGEGCVATNEEVLPPLETGAVTLSQQSVSGFTPTNAP